MARRQVTCINKRPSHYAAHERIQNVGGSGWKLTEDQAIANLRVGADSYFVSVGGRTTEVVLATHNGRTYLKTQADGYAPNNLLDLPECP